jgi:hypothetical protein
LSDDEEERSGNEEVERDDGPSTPQTKKSAIVEVSLFVVGLCGNY